MEVYENLDFRPRAWLEGGQATITYWAPDRITLASDGPGGMLVMSEINYPGWQAEVDGAPVAISATDGLLRSVSLPAGEHTIIFEFQP